ncbi:MAG: hypothetical protein ABGX10_06660 [Paracoccus sp. (in: a-proteobacteria)]|uniref:hypothetical protein n=1 Tax=Paracoccus sp. TaxID=267 RepID=UPI0032428A61
MIALVRATVQHNPARAGLGSFITGGDLLSVKLREDVAVESRIEIRDSMTLPAFGTESAQIDHEITEAMATIRGFIPGRS